MKLSFESTILLLFLVLAYFHPSSAKNPCTAHSDCGSCFRANGDCAFCKDEDFSSSGVRLDRCNYANVLKELGCKSLMNVQGEHKFEKEENFTFFRQVSPQKITLNLRPAQTNKFKIKVKPAKGFPVDLYYLMDMSKSMENDLNELNKLGIKIADEIGEITPKYRLAFGSFVDKTVAPFIQPAQLNKPCMLEDNVTPCKPTFGYNHIFDFNDNKTSFQERINQQNISGNLDTPEGGFDALMQVASCNSTLNWEPVDRAHRIVIFVTDATPHIAGDGKLGGIIQPNDGLCHLQISTNDQSTKEYTQSNKQDYPSISKLKSKLKSNDIIPIFAVTENVQSVYKKIVDEWKDMNARIGVLKGDSSNIVELIRKTYSEIITTIRLSDNSPSDIKVFYKADESCPNVIEEGAGCSNITAGDEYGFDVMVTATNCPKGVAQVPTQSFVINIPGLGKIDVDVNLQCECPCEAPGMGVQNSTSCNGTGTFQCGICYCGSGYHGEKCECDNEAEADDTLCIPNNTTDVVCSGAGSCVCGECVCNKRLNAGEFISGRYCECNNYGCDRHDGQLCGGPERGICECGSCKCTDAYLGDNCGQVNCTIAEKNCLNPDNGEVCSGNGVCDCEKCNCEVGYIGKYCQTCVSCETKCGEYKDCIQCVLDNNGPLASNNCTSCAYLDIRLVEYEVEGTCRFQIDENCHYEYDYTQGLNETVIVRKACVVVTNESIPILYIVIGIVAGLIVLAFLLLIIWKIIVTAYDNYEYQKFLKQSKPEFESKNENALYKAPKTVYDNPTYAHNNPYE